MAQARGIIRAYEEKISHLESELASAYERIRSLESQNRKLQIVIDPGLTRPRQSRIANPLTPEATPERKTHVGPDLYASYFSDDDTSDTPDEFPETHHESVSTPLPRTPQSTRRSTKEAPAKSRGEYEVEERVERGTQEAKPESKASVASTGATVVPSTVTPPPARSLSDSDQELLKGVDISTGTGRPSPILDSELPIDIKETLAMTIQTAKDTPRRAEMWPNPVRSTACLISRAKGGAYVVPEGDIGTACERCEDLRRMCVQKTKQGRPCAVPLRKEVRGGGKEEIGFWRLG